MKWVLWNDKQPDPKNDIRRICRNPDNHAQVKHLHWEQIPVTWEWLDESPPPAEPGRIEMLEKGIQIFLHWLKDKRPHITGAGAPIAMLEELLRDVVISTPAQDVSVLVGVVKEVIEYCQNKDVPNKSIIAIENSLTNALKQLK